MGGYGGQGWANAGGQQAPAFTQPIAEAVALSECPFCFQDTRPEQLGPPLDCAHRACIKCDAVLKWKCCPPCRKLLEQSAQPPPTQQPPSPQQQQEQGQPPLPPQQQAPQQNASYDPSAAMDYDDSPVYPTSTATNSGHTQSASATSAPPSHPNDRSPHNTATAPATHPQQQTNVYSSTEWGHAPPPSMPPHQAGQPPAPVGWSAPPIDASNECACAHAPAGRAPPKQFIPVCHGCLFWR